jgi:hypothetical protein
MEMAAIWMRLAERAEATAKNPHSPSQRTRGRLAHSGASLVIALAAEPICSRETFEVRRNDDVAC